MEHDVEGLVGAGRYGRGDGRLTTRLEGLYGAIADGLRTPELLAKIKGLEQKKIELEAGLEAPPPSPVRLHPNLADPLIRDEAITILRGLIDEVRLGHGESGWSAEFKGEIRALVGLGLSNDKAPRSGLPAEALNSTTLVAGARDQLHLLFTAYDLCR